jgi:hypothetical protein
MLRRVALVTTDVSKELSASFIRVTRIGELGTTLAVTSNWHTLRKNVDFPVSDTDLLPMLYRNMLMHQPSGNLKNENNSFIKQAIYNNNININNDKSNDKTVEHFCRHLMYNLSILYLSQKKMVCNSCMEKHILYAQHTILLRPTVFAIIKQQEQTWPNYDAMNIFPNFHIYSLKFHCQIFT